MNTRRTILRLIGGVLGLAGLVRPVRAAAAAGEVVGAVGSCIAETQGQARPLTLGNPVYVADTIEVPAGARLKLRMSDGSVISLASGTRLAIADYRTGAGGVRVSAQLSLAQGLLRAVVAKVDRPATFEVSTAVGVAAVRSTDWFIDTQPASAQVGVLEGSVSLTSAATGRSVTIPARWGTKLYAGRDPLLPRVWAPAEFDAVIARTKLG
ncbi:MAG TPA: FecR family protein [Stellaceae bacterium]|nr:FecR family protein [Stellaceae bacterium]